jgi:hypothetical protein
MKPITLIQSGVAILIGATVGILNVPSVLDSGKISQVAVVAEAYLQADVLEGAICSKVAVSAATALESIC